ncbi:MAG: tRNA glutamyl-Q(34) synthetase GluQRS [Elainellaceae cyanobacterium]
MPYRGRLAPTPTGHLHLGHAKTFWTAQQRAEQANGTLILRIEDLDRDRCKPQYAVDLVEDLTWFGFRWQEGPNVGGDCGPYTQSERHDHYRQIWQQLNQTGTIYPSPHSRKDVAQALSAPHEGDREIIFPAKLRPANWDSTWQQASEPGEVNWRFQVPDGETVTFVDQGMGPQSFTAGEDFGDFIVWRRDGFPSYELAVVADDGAMAISEVVRGEDLLLSTAKQILLYRALGWEIPAFYHCPLVRDEAGTRLAKRDGARSLRSLRQRGVTPEEIRSRWDEG